MGASLRFLRGGRGRRRRQAHEQGLAACGVLGDGGNGEDDSRSPKRDTQGTGPLGGCGQSPPFSPRDGGGIWRSREGLQDGLRRRRMKRNVLSGKGAFSSVIRVFPSLADCVPPVPPARLPALPERQTARNALSPVNPPKSGAPTLKRLCPTGANSVERAPPQRPLPQRGKAASPRALPYRMPVSPGIARPCER